MTTYSDTEKERILRYPIESVLAHYGKRTGHRGRMYYSPFRDEKEPSFSVDRKENLWMDFGTGRGGNVLTLVSELEGVPVSAAWDIVAGMDPGLVVTSSRDTSIPSAKETRGSRIVIDGVFSEFSRPLVRYALSRGIPQHLLTRYCREVAYHVDGFAGSRRVIAFPTEDGWVLRSPGGGPYAKRCTGSRPTFLGASGAATDGPSCARVEVFEGFFDFLSWLVLKDRTKPFSDVCVLNSVNNLPKAMEFISAHGSVSVWTDADEAGRKAASEILSRCPGALDHGADLALAGAKDVNELLLERVRAAKEFSRKEILQPKQQPFTIKI